MAICSICGFTLPGHNANCIKLDKKYATKTVADAAKKYDTDTKKIMFSTEVKRLHYAVNHVRYIEDRLADDSVKRSLYEANLGDIHFFLSSLATTLKMVADATLAVAEYKK